MRALLLMLGAVFALSALAQPAYAEEHRGHDDRGGRDFHRGGHGRWGGGPYYPPPPVVYGYGQPYYPPPVVYGSGIGIQLPGVGIHIR